MKNGRGSAAGRKSAQWSLQGLRGPVGFGKYHSRAAESEGSKHGILIEETRVSLRAEAFAPLRSTCACALASFSSARTSIFPARWISTGNSMPGFQTCGAAAMAPVGSIACGLLEPRLRRLDGQRFPLMSIPLGELQLRDVRIAVSDTVEITAEFGSNT